MAVKNALKTVKSFRETNRISPYYDISWKNVCDLSENSGGKIDALINSFVLGYIQGLKAAQKGERIK